MADVAFARTPEGLLYLNALKLAERELKDAHAALARAESDGRVAEALAGRLEREAARRLLRLLEKHADARRFFVAVDSRFSALCAVLGCDADERREALRPYMNLECGAFLLRRALRGILARGGRA